MSDCKRPVKVMRVATKYLEVLPVASNLCPTCARSGRCRSDWLRTFDKQRTFDIPLIEPISVKKGDIIYVILRNGVLIKLVSIQYGFPLLGLLAGISVGHLMLLPEFIQLAFGLCLTSLGWLFACVMQTRFSIEVIK